MNCHRDFAAFRSKLKSGTALETRDAGPASFEEIKKILDGIGATFAEYKSVNDQRMKEIEAKGAADPVTVEKLAKVDATITDLEAIKRQIEALENRANRPGAGAGGDVDPVTGRKLTEAEQEYKSAFLDFLRDPKNSDKERSVRERERGLERRAVDTLTGVAGGFAVPEVLANEITRFGVDISPVRSVARVITAGTSDYKELVDVGGAAFTWAGETDARSDTGTPALAEVAPTFGMGYAYPKASEESLQDIFFNVEDWLVNSAGEAIAQGEGVAFISGNGTKKPTGFLSGTPVATADAGRAFGVLQYVASGQAAAMPTSQDNLVALVHSLRARYRANASWMLNKLTLSSIRTYKATDGQYLWEPSLQMNTPSTYLGYPVVEAEDMPDVAANAFPIAFGDFREGYLIVDLAGMRITRDEITEPGYVKFYVRKRVGGKVKNSQAIKLLKIAAS